MASCDFTSILPENATTLELSVEEVMHEKYCADAFIVKKLSDPWECPAEFLPWLAYAESVDVWRDKWPELTKRSVIANARTLHKRKGTEGGVRDALAALGVRMEMISWQDMSPEGEPGTVSFQLWINENFNPSAAVMLDESMISDITQTVNRNKRLSVHYTLLLGIEVVSKSGLAVSGQLASQTSMNIQNTTAQIDAGDLASGVAVSAHAATYTQLSAMSQLADISAGSLMTGVGFSSQSTTLTLIDMKDIV